MTMSVEERVEKFKCVCTPEKKKKKSTDSGNDNKQVKSPKGKSKERIQKRKRQSSEQVKSSPAPSPAAKLSSKRRRLDEGSSHKDKKSEGSFEVFCRKHRDSMMADHPEFDEATLNECLQQQWLMMSQKQKSRYKSKLQGHFSMILVQLI